MDTHRVHHRSNAHHRMKHHSRARVCRRPLPTDIRHSPFVSRAVWRPRWFWVLGVTVVVLAALVL